MSRTISYLAGLVAVVAAAGSGLAWLATHVANWTVAVCGIALMSSLWVLWVQERTERGADTSWAHLVPFFVATAVAASAASIAEEKWGAVPLYIWVAMGAIPAFWLGHRIDRHRHKECPDCCERISARARVCRYCGHEFADSN